MKKRLHCTEIIVTARDGRKRRKPMDLRNRRYFSDLPDDILISILSLLEDKERARTSILSRRWRSLWRYALIFRFMLELKPYHDHDEIDRMLFAARGFKDGLTPLERSIQCKQFVDSINRSVDSCLSPTIDDFSVSCDEEDMLFHNDVDRWLKFAFAKRVKHLMLHLGSPYRWDSLTAIDQDVFPLKSLNLSCVQVTGQVLEHIISVCPSLEELTVSGSQTLVDLTVTGPSLKLKHLEITGCRKLNCIHIHNVNHLATLKYDGLACCLVKDAPKLVNASLDLYVRGYKKNYYYETLSHVPQLETLKLQITGYKQNISRYPKMEKLRNLRQLELVMCPKYVFCVGLCAYVMKAVPTLVELKLSFKTFYNERKEARVQKLEHPHKGLKMVELTGFVGCRHDLGVVSYIIENTVSLDKMIIDARHPDYRSGWEEKAVMTAKKFLAKRLPSSTNWVVKGKCLAAPKAPLKSRNKKRSKFDYDTCIDAFDYDTCIDALFVVPSLL